MKAKPPEGAWFSVAKGPISHTRRGKTRMTREEEEIIRTVIAKRVIERMAEQWDALALAAICGDAGTPAHRVPGKRPEQDSLYWPMVKLDKRC